MVLMSRTADSNFPSGDLFVEVQMYVRLGDEFDDGLIAWLCINHMCVK